jgi:GH24 family phage-related lysozyme (muramidase)
MTVDVSKVYEEISEDEGKILHCYMCSEGHKTVGIGHKVLQNDPESNLPVHGAYDNVPEDQSIDEDRCYELFQEDVQTAIAGCQVIYENWDDLPVEAQHVLTNMCFQLGQGGLSRFKNMNSAITEQLWNRVAEEMLDSRWARQTPARAERLSQRIAALAGE